MQIKLRDITLAILLTCITCGFYWLYWMYRLTDEIHALSDKPRTPKGSTVVLYTVLTCSLYFYYWLYNIGSELVELRRANGFPADSVASKTYDIVNIAMAFLYIILMSLRYAVEGIFTEIAQEETLLENTYDVETAIGFFILMFMAEILFLLVVQLVFSIICILAVHKSKNDSPVLIYMLMALLRTNAFTISFLQHSLNDFLQKKDMGSLALNTPAASVCSPKQDL